MRYLRGIAAGGGVGRVRCHQYDAIDLHAVGACGSCGRDDVVENSEAVWSNEQKGVRTEGANEVNVQRIGTYRGEESARELKQ
jgi:hypothetical protein